MLPDIHKLRQAAKAKLTPRRYRHSLAVQKQAIHLAGRYGADWYKAAVAAIIHDICKDMHPDAQLNYLKSCGILVDVLTLENPAVWHAMAGEQYAKEILEIDDPDILSAVRYHTTGRKAMSLLEKVIYIADFTSEDRHYPDVACVRALSEQSLDLAVQYCLRHTMQTLLHTSRPIIQDAWEAYNYYMQ